MAGPTRPTPPSAIDGFRRLERTRTVATTSAAIAASATFDERPAMPRASRRRRARRFAGAARLLVLVAVLATIIGSSYSLASSGGGVERAPAEREPATDTVPARSSEPTTSSPTGDAAASDMVATATEPTVEPVATEVVAAAAPATVTAPTGQLPLTDFFDMQRLLLAGSLLVLLGMLVQVAGQPLPARTTR